MLLARASAPEPCTNMLTIHELISRSAQPGRLTWIGVRPERRAPMLELEEAELIAERGLQGDRASAKVGRSRQVTLIQTEHLTTIGALLGRSSINPELLRRNLAISGINILSLRNARFRIGECELEGTGHCHPCSRLEETLGFGGYNATRGLGGITARVLQGGAIRLRDPVLLLKGQPENG
jgi:MOSC domain-containing protein YiiM